MSQPWDEEKGPRVIFADSTQSIHLADMSGDGLTDIVRIRNGEVCYWPNLGYGRFGAKVTMDNAPWFDRPDIFDQRRIHLADIDGSGTTDIIYLSGSWGSGLFQSVGEWLGGEADVELFSGDRQCGIHYSIRPVGEWNGLPGVVFALAGKCPAGDALYRLDGRAKAPFAD